MNNFEKSKICAVLSSIIIICGCFAPWLKFGNFFRDPGINGIDGAIVITLAIITGVIANYSQKSKSAPSALYGIFGSIILIIAMFDVFTATTRAKDMANSFRELQQYFLETDSITFLSFMGPGLFMVLAGSIGLMISAFFASSWENSDSLPPSDPQETFNKTNELANAIELNFDTQLMSKKNELDENEQKVALLNSLIVDAGKSMFSSSKKSEISDLLNNICISKNECEKLLDNYANLYNSDLVSKLLNLSSSYEAKKTLIRPFIEYDIVEENFPHERKML